MSYGIYIGKNHSATGHAWLAGYGDEPSSHWLEICPRQQHPKGATVTVGVTDTADMPGVRSTVPQVPETARNIRVSYSHYKGVPAPITNGGLNEYGVAVRDIWSPSRDELVEMTPETQTGPNYSDLARFVIERAKTARAGVELIGQLISEHGESTYGGNSHIIADSDEAWVVIQCAGGQGLWAAERLGPDSIRASRPGYILEIPVDQPEHPDFLYAPNLVAFAKEQGWYAGGAFNFNAVYGDSKGRWDGVAWIEDEMRSRAGERKVTFQDVVWAIRTPRLTGDTAGYGQVVPLISGDDGVEKMLWHAPIGAVAAPFSPVFLAQKSIPPEFGPHRYLTEGEAHRFLDDRKSITDGDDALSMVPQTHEMTRSAVYECKRLMYLMIQDAERFEPEVTAAFEGREASLADTCAEMSAAAATLRATGEPGLACAVLTYFSEKELLGGMQLVKDLSAGLEARLRSTGYSETGRKPKSFQQIW